MNRIRVGLMLIAIASASACAPKQQTPTVAEAPELLVIEDYEDAIAMIRDHFSLSDEQTDQIRRAVIERSARLREVVNASHDDQPDPETMIAILNDSRDEFQSDLSEILTPEQMEVFLEHRDTLNEAVMTAAAARRVAIMDNPLGLTDEQALQMAAVIGQATTKLIIVLERFAGRRIGLMQKVELGRAFLAIRDDTDKQLAEILSKEQMTQYKQLRKELAAR